MGGCWRWWAMQKTMQKKMQKTMDFSPQKAFRKGPWPWPDVQAEYVHKIFSKFFPKRESRIPV